MKRRTFLKLAAVLPLAGRVLAAPAETGSPLAATTTRFGTTRSGEGPWSGDEFTLPHRFIRDHEALPAATDEGPVHDVIVVGGGPSGLIAAWMLKELDVLVLEKDRTAGGTSKSETWNGIPYAIGAAYFGVPERGSAIDRMYRSLGMHQHWRTFADRDEGIFRGAKLEMGFWDRPDAKDIASALGAMNEHRYTEVPFTANDVWTADEMAQLDRMTWAQLLEQGVPAQRGQPPVKLPPAIREFCSWFAPAVTGARPEEVSAWVMLNQFLAEFGPLAALPGGNGWITQRLVEEIDAVKPGRVRPGHMAVSVETAGDRVRVVTMGADGRARTHTAKAAIFAGPKFVAARIVKGLPPEQIDAITQLLYRPFVVANVLLKKPVMDRNVYDAYTKDLPPGSEMSDITFADYAIQAKGPSSVLTCYFPLPRDDARAQLLDPARLPFLRKQLTTDLLAVLGPRGLTSGDIVDMRFTRWGHPMIVAKPGQLSAGVFARASAPSGRVSFAHQDNMGNPCIESSFAAAQAAVRHARELVG